MDRCSFVHNDLSIVNTNVSVSHVRERFDRCYHVDYEPISTMVYDLILSLLDNVARR
jgi:hypothetical protein